MVYQPVENGCFGIFVWKSPKLWPSDSGLDSLTSLRCFPSFISPSRRSAKGFQIKTCWLICNSQGTCLIQGWELYILAIAMVHLDLKIKVRGGISGLKWGWMMHFSQYLKPNACFILEILKKHTHPLLASVLCIQWQTLLLHWHLKFYSIKECGILHTSCMWDIWLHMRCSSSWRLFSVGLHLCEWKMYEGFILRT